MKISECSIFFDEFFNENIQKYFILIIKKGLNIYRMEKINEEFESIVIPSWI